MKDKPLFFAYARKSPTGFTAGQTEKDPIPSIDRQEADLMAMAARFPACDYADCYRELESAVEVAWDERPVLKQLLSDIKPGDHLGLWRLDRLERNPFRLISALDLLTKREVSIHVEIGMGGFPVDMSCAMGRGMVMMLAWMADMFRELQVDGIKRGLAWRKRAGLHMGGTPPLGRTFVPIPGQRTHLGNQQYRVEWDDHQCAIIREIRNRMAAGEFAREIAKDFIRRKLVKGDGKTPWAYESKGKIRVAPIIQAHVWYKRLLESGKDMGDVEPTPESIEAMLEREQAEREERCWKRREAYKIHDMIVDREVRAPKKYKKQKERCVHILKLRQSARERALQKGLERLRRERGEDQNGTGGP